MKVIYLHNNGFVVELEKVTLIFDQITNIPNHFIRKGRRNYFFATSAQTNHFGQRIFAYDFEYNSTYVLSDDISKRGGRSVHYMKPYENLEFDGVQIHTFGSTCGGVSFIVEAEGKIFFHAGSLNWWDWSVDDMPGVIPAVEEADFKAEVDKIRDALGCYQIDVAFLPVAKCLGKSAYKGACHIAEVLQPKVIAPMGFEDEYDMIDGLQHRLFGKDIKVLSMDDRNQIIYSDED